MREAALQGGRVSNEDDYRSGQTSAVVGDGSQAGSTGDRQRQGLPVLDLPYLVLMKVEAGRAQDLADTARMLGLTVEPRRQETRETFRRWSPDALDDLKRLITLGRLEMET